ncbi:hypothetical protein HMPREF9372_1279 [Sporosarcina newyorkensis 2681]|uniref:Uncharacterized protein n=1 Tax=Sporosarcina newyorkensis 2681 TaxID=1027292 RepID=F9DR49_9BACL|nr:hypothetical protein [Sporosarcina newyorkensis]EGQ26738.1 hypothetical protein HMPREF9372_1279 [Sporosarcina newyorkensis 2681]
MFYVKEKISPAVDVTVDIHDDNVFCTCPDCGCEVNVDLAQLFLAGEGDLYSTSVYCVDCSKPRLKVSSNKK